MVPRARAIAVLVFGVAAGWAYAADKSDVNLGGPRRVVATISDDERQYTVTVRMIPVRCFDAALNAHLTREKGLAYARIALARHIAGRHKGKIKLDLRNGEVTDSQIDDSHAVLTVRFPADAVSVRPAGKEPRHAEKDPHDRSVPAESDKEPVNNSLLTAKDDELATLESLVKQLRAYIPRVPKTKQARKLSIGKLRIATNWPKSGSRSCMLP